MTNQDVSVVSTRPVFDRKALPRLQLPALSLPGPGQAMMRTQQACCPTDCFHPTVSSQNKGQEKPQTGFLGWAGFEKAKPTLKQVAPNLPEDPAQVQMRDRIKRSKAEHEARFQERLRRVQWHESAHALAGAGFTGSTQINANPETGEVSGHVPIQMHFGSTAEEALRFAGIIAGAALAPGPDASPEDRTIAAVALSTGNAIAAQRREEEVQRKKKPTRFFNNIVLSTGQRLL